MYLSFCASETVNLPVEEQEISIKHYLRQPHRLVNAITEPELMKQLAEELYELKMRPINFMEMYHFQPTVSLKVWAGASGTVYLQSQDCEIKGIEYINDRFSFNLKGKLSPYLNENKTYLKGQADLKVKVELPPALWLTPKPLLELTGNRLLRSILIRIKQKMMSKLIQDYQQWTDHKKEDVINYSLLSSYE